MIFQYPKQYLVGFGVSLESECDCDGLLLLYLLMVLGLCKLIALMQVKLQLSPISFGK